MDVITESDAAGFRYEVIGKGGSDYVGSRVFVPVLETERKISEAGDADRGAITPDNYTFEDRGAEPTGLAWVGVTPKRKDWLLVDGSIFLQPENGDLVRMQGLLAKNPSFWTRHVEIVGRYERINGVRMPVQFESAANVFFAGKSTFTMHYVYESVNGHRVAAH